MAEFMQEHSGYLVFIDMDNLKKINDLYGHKAGDRALKLLGGLLADYHEAAVACRLGGDEFLLFVPEISREQISWQIRELFARFRQLTADDVEVNCASLSAGLCMCTKGDSFEECYSKADKALYYVKQNGKNQFFFYQQINRRDLAAGTGRDLALVAKSLHDTSLCASAHLTSNYRDFARQYEYMLQPGATCKVAVAGLPRHGHNGHRRGHPPAHLRPHRDTLCVHGNRPTAATIRRVDM
ncbi:MAG: GGDEF domain-containing protein [Lachnospiraceae bacterium]